MTTKTRTRWTRTVKAAKAEQSSSWAMIWALADEAFERDATYANISSGLVIEEIRLELEAAGVPLKFQTVQARALVGKFAHAATRRDSDVLRSVPWTVVREAVNYGATAEAAAQHIRDCRAAKVQPTAATMRQAFNLRSEVEEPAGPRYSDDRYLAALAVIAEHTTAERAGLYQPGAMARLGGTLLGQMLVGQVDAPADWDAALAGLVNAEEGER